jgi:hypothetical protein
MTAMQDVSQNCALHSLLRVPRLLEHGQFLPRYQVTATDIDRCSALTIIIMVCALSTYYLGT